MTFSIGMRRAMARFAAAFFIVMMVAAGFAGPSGDLAFAKSKPKPSVSPTPTGSPTPTPEERIAKLEATLKDNPNDKNAHAELGLLLVETGKPQQGRDELQQAIKLGLTGEAQVWFFIGIADRELGDLPDAVHTLERASLLDPANLAILTNLTDTYIAVGRLDDALRVANRTVQLHPQESTAYDAVGTVLLDMGKIDEGRKQLFKSLELDPKGIRARLLVGRSYLADKVKRPDLALEQINIVLAADPKNVEALHAKAEALGDKNDVDGAVATLNEIVKLQPDKVEPEDEIAGFYLTKNMVDKAREAFTKAAQDHPKSPEPWYLQASYDWQHKNFALAGKEFDSALAVAPDDPRILFDYARMLLTNLNQPQRAKDMLVKVVKARPNDPESLFWLGQADAALGNWREAKDHFSTSFQMERTYVGLFNLALAYYNLKDYRNARAALEALIPAQKIHPDPQMWFVLGDTDRRMGDKRSAIAAFTQFLRLQPRGQAADKARAYIKQLQK